MTPEEFDATPASAWVPYNRYELIRGVLVVSPAVSYAEADPNEELGLLLRIYQGTHPEGRAIDFTLSERTVPTTENRRRCDRAVWVNLGRLPDPETDVPAIVVEFVSAQRRDAVRDYVEKRDEYLAVGVREYWIIDRFRRIMTVHRNGPDGPTERVVAEAQTYETDLLPGFVLPLAKLLGLADRWKKPRPKHPRTPPARGTDG